MAKLTRLLSVKRGGEVKPVRKSRSRFPPVIVSTVSASTSKFAATHRSIMLLVRPLSLWKYNWKSFGVLIVEPISSMLIVPRDEMPNMVPNFSGSLGDRPFTVMMEQPLKRRRCAEQGHVYFLPHDGNRHVDAFDTRENVGHQIAPLLG